MPRRSRSGGSELPLRQMPKDQEDKKQFRTWFRPGEDFALRASKKRIRAGIVDAERVRPMAGKIPCRLPPEIMDILSATAAREGVKMTAIVEAIVEAWLERDRVVDSYHDHPEAVLWPEVVADAAAVKEGERATQITVRLSKGNLRTLDGKHERFKPLTKQRLVRCLLENWIVEGTRAPKIGEKRSAAYETLSDRLDHRNAQLVKLGFGKSSSRQPSELTGPKNRKRAEK